MTAVDHLNALLSRHGVVKMDGTDRPFEVTVWTEHGARRFYGANLETALKLAESGTRKGAA